MRLTRASIPRTLGLAGTVNLQRYPDRGPNWYAVFRLRRPGEAGRGKLVSRSTGCSDKTAAEPMAALIFTQALAEYLGYALVPIRPDATPIPGLGGKVGPSPTTPFHPKVVALAPSLDPLLEDVINLYLRTERLPDGRRVDCYMAEKTPGSHHPADDTATTYCRRLRQLTQILGVRRYSELRDAYKGLTPDRLRKLQAANGTKPEQFISDDNFVPLVRGAAGVFSIGALKYYQSRGVSIQNPFPSLPAVRIKHFEAPPDEFIDELCHGAERELKDHPVKNRDYIVFRLASRIGGRFQEITHMKWEDVTATGIFIGPRKTKRGRFIKLREHGEPEELLDYLESFRKANTDYVIEDGFCPIRKETSGEVKNRCLRLERRLVGWLREKISAAGLGEIRTCIHWLRKCVGDRIERRQGALTRAAVMGTAIADAARRDPGVAAAAAALGNSPQVAAAHYIGRKSAFVRAS